MTMTKLHDFVQVLKDLGKLHERFLNEPEKKMVEITSLIEKKEKEYNKLYDEIQTAINFYENTHIVHTKKIFRCKVCKTPMINKTNSPFGWKCPYWDQTSQRCEKEIN